MNWKCNKCGSEEVQQEYGFLRLMNSDSEEPLARRQILDQRRLRIDEAINAWQNDFFWCVDCDEECSPIRKKETK